VGFPSTNGLTGHLVQCAFGKGVQRGIALAVSQMILDIVGDLLSEYLMLQDVSVSLLGILLNLCFKVLYIPVRLIWKVKIRWSQKIALASCLCLTILTIMCTITRISGIHTGRTVQSVDSVWETYWQFIAANLALTMTAATAFRTFVSRVRDREAQPPRSRKIWYMKSQRFLHSLFTPWSWRLKPSGDSSREGNGSDVPMQLPYQFPGGTMTGIQTFIDGQGRTKAEDSQISRSMAEEYYDDPWSLSTDGRNAQVSRCSAMSH